MGLRSGEKARMLSFRNRIEVIPVRDIRSLRGYLKGIDTTFVRGGDAVSFVIQSQRPILE